MPKQCVSPFLMDELLRGQLLRPYIIFPGGPATGVSPTSCQDLLNRYWGEEPKKKKYKRKKKKKISARPVMGARLFPSPSPSKESDPCIMRALMGRPCIPHIIPL